jgi:hypothetical protein
MISRTTKLVMAGVVIVIALFYIVIIAAMELASEAEAPATTSVWTP